MNELIAKPLEKKSVKKDVNKLSRTLIYCQIILILIYFFCTFFLYFKNNYSIDTITEKYEGIIYIVSVTAGCLCFLHYYKYNSTQDISTVTKKLSFRNIIICTAIILALQFFSQIAISLLETSLNLFGYSLINSLEQVANPSGTISMFLYASFIGPLIEEFIFRGIIIKKLEKYGKMFAIIISSVMFGFYHSNAYQGIIAFSIGLLLGYIALEYSIKYSIILHIINNMILSELYSLINNNINAAIASAVSFLLFAGAVVVFIVAINKYKRRLHEYVKDDHIFKNIYKYAFTSSFFIVFLALNAIISFISIEKI